MTENPKKARVRISQDDILDLFKDYRVLTVDQIQSLLNAPTQYSIRNQLKVLSDKNKSSYPLTGSMVVRPWNGPKSRFWGFFLTENGANTLSARYEKTYYPTNPNTLPANLAHNVGLADIAIALKKMGLEFDIEQRTPVSEETTEYIRPDVICQVGEVKYMIEFEQTRAETSLKERILNRFLRWQKMLSDPENVSISKDVFVLFSLDKKDKHTIATWMEALYLLEQEAGAPAAFAVRIMNISAFLKSPTLDPTQYNRLIPSENPESDLLAAAREKFFDRIAATRMNPETVQETFTKAISFWENYWGYLLLIEGSIATRKTFLDNCDRLYRTSLLNREKSTCNASIPWGAISAVRRWLEDPSLSDFRTSLIDATERFKSSYSRGINAAADALDRLVWEVLLRKFEIGRGGSLSFRTQLGSDSKDDKYQRSGLIPIFTIALPWQKIRETEEEAEFTCLSLAWLVTLIMDFQTELGLTRAEKKPLSSALLDPADSDDL